MPLEQGQQRPSAVQLPEAWLRRVLVHLEVCLPVLLPLHLDACGDSLAPSTERILDRH